MTRFCRGTLAKISLRSKIASEWQFYRTDSHCATSVRYMSQREKSLVNGDARDVGALSCSPQNPKELKHGKSSVLEVRLRVRVVPRVKTTTRKKIA